MKRPLEDPGDRAQRHRRLGLCRIPLDKLGYLPDNRGGLGISPFHVHELAWDCVANGVKLSRYTHVDIVKIPAEIGIAAARLRGRV